MLLGQGKKLGEVPGSQPGVHFIEGFLWEIALEYVHAGMGIDEAIELAFKRYMTALRSNIVKQIQLVKDDIHMTPDGYNHVEGVMESYKSTRKKLRKSQADFEKHFWPWIIQEGSYCWAKKIDTARWIVLFNAGDYSLGPGSPPRMMESTATWGPSELSEIWGRVLEHERHMK